MADVFVSPQGSDSNSGSHHQPLATLARAIEASRKSGGQRRILLGGGNYYDVRAALMGCDSGLTIEAADGERPVLHGGRLITDWQRDGEHFWSAHLPGVKERRWDFRTLIVNGGWRDRSRLPQVGRYSHPTTFDVKWLSSTDGGWQRKPTIGELTTMRYYPGDLGTWTDLANAELTIYHAWDESMVSLASLDEATQTVTFATPAGHPPGAFGYWRPEARTYVAWNLRQGMLRPGQWYLDRTEGKLVYWPLEGENLAEAAVLAPTCNCILDLGGDEGQPVTDVSLRGLSLACTSAPMVTGGFGAAKFPAAISGEHCRNLVLDGVNIANVGGGAIKIGSGRDVRIERCDLGHTGGSGVILRSEQGLIRDCEIHDIGLAYPSGIGVLASGARVDIEHNHFHHTSYSCIHLSAGGSRVQSNLFHDYMQTMLDGGAVYVGFCKGIQVLGNVVRGGGGTQQSHAYYIDEQSEDFLVEGNLAVNARWPSHNHRSANCTIRRNVLVDDGDSLITMMLCKGFVFEKNIWFAHGRLTLQAFRDSIARMGGNLLHSGSAQAVAEWFLPPWTSECIEALPTRDGTVYGDPCFTNPAGGDYTFGPDSPAAFIGIEPIDVRKAGRLTRP